MSETHLKGLPGTNPLGFLAAVGIQVAYVTEPAQPRLWWSNDVLPHAVIDGSFVVDHVVEMAAKALSAWRDSPILNPGEWLTKNEDFQKDSNAADKLKLTPKGIRRYLRECMEDPGAELVTALVADGGLDKSDSAKHSHLYFTTAQQVFLNIMRNILENASEDEIHTALTGPWEYKSTCPSLGWDVADDSNYALSATDPSKDKKLTNPGPEALAVLGLSRYPVFVYNNKTVTQGCHGMWTRATFSWPLWNKPASPAMVKSLLAQAYEPAGREDWLRAWSVFRILRSPIRRTNGYGTFGPPDVIWESGET